MDINFFQIEKKKFINTLNNCYTHKNISIFDFNLNLVLIVMEIKKRFKTNPRTFYKKLLFLSFFIQPYF